MAQVIAYQMNDGVSIVIPTGEIPLEGVISKDVPAGVNYKVIDQSELPSDRSFRGAWEFNDGVKINLSKAKEIHKEKIRFARTSLLSELDIQFQRALETNLDTSEIVAKKNALRDAPSSPAIASAKTIENLKSTWDESLLGPSPYTTR